MNATQHSAAGEIIPFDFEEQAVRVVMRDGEPWFVASDICRVLEISNSRDAVGRLDDDERDDVGITDTIGRSQKMTVISESGLYALIWSSRKPEAKKFRKWVTSVVLPALRKSGSYTMPGHAPAATVTEAPAEAVLPGGGTIREAELWLSMVREARLLKGTTAGISMWSRSPLPPLSPAQPLLSVSPAEGRACLDHLLTVVSDTLRTGDDAALSGQGLRLVEDGLFVANGDHPVFRSTRWSGGAHRSALMAVPGARFDGPRTLAGHPCRGVVIPEAYVAEVAHG